MARGSEILLAPPGAVRSRSAPHPVRDRLALASYLGRLRAVQIEAIALGLTRLGSQFDEPIAAARRALQAAR